MKKLFIHNPLFRLLSPIFSGFIVYLLILLVNNNVAQIQEQFFGQELYVCIGLSYINQEFSRLLLVLFKKIPVFYSQLVSLIVQILISLLLCIVLVTVAITIYYKQVLGFSPSLEDLYMFNSIFCVITFIYILLYVSHQYLYKINSKRLTEEKITKKNIEEDFKQFKQGINPNLLFESLESLLVLIKKNKEDADVFIDNLATIYRYILSGKKHQLVKISEEISNTLELVNLFNYLPYRKISIQNKVGSNFLTVPGSLLFVVEQIVRSTIISSDVLLNIVFTESDEFLELSYITNDKITEKFTLKNIEEIQRIYSVYSDKNILVHDDSKIRKIRFPKLKIKK